MPLVAMRDDLAASSIESLTERRRTATKSIAIDGFLPTPLPEA